MRVIIDGRRGERDERSPRPQLSVETSQLERMEARQVPKGSV